MAQQESPVNFMARCSERSGVDYRKVVLTYDPEVLLQGAILCKRDNVYFCHVALDVAEYEGEEYTPHPEHFRIVVLK